MGRFRSVLVLAILVLTPVLVTAERPGDDAGSVVDRWVTAFNSNDVDALVSLYAPDAILLGSTDLTLKEGSEAIRGYFARLAQAGTRCDRKSSCSTTMPPTRSGSMNSARSCTASKSWAGFT